MIVFLRPHLSSVASGAETWAGPPHSLTLQLAPAKLSLPDNVLLYYMALTQICSGNI